jgi:hypothetical protein
MDFDTDVDNYTDQEIQQLLEIPDMEYNTIINKTKEMIDEYEDNPELIKFYNDIRIKYEKKSTVVETIDVEIKKGTINPDLKNTITRMINIDSSYRELSTETIYDTDNYVFTLNEPINNVISLLLYSIEIPQSWYTFTFIKGTTVFQPILIAQNNTSTIKYEYPIVRIPDGNYTSKSLLNIVTTVLFRDCGIFSQQTMPLTTPPTLISDIFMLEQDAYTGRCKMTLKTKFDITKIILPDGSPFSPTYTKCKFGFVFNSVELKTKINYNLGWLLGFRLPLVMVLDLLTEDILDKDSVHFSESIIDTAGTKYIILKLDDYKSNRLNKSLVCINTKTENKIPLPSYYNKSLSQYQTSPTTINVLPQAPRQLTSKQLYTINSISNKRIIDISTKRLTSPDDCDIFAKIPIKKVTEWGVVNSDGSYSAIDNGPGKLIIEFSGPLQLNIREYFGPVNMTSFSVSLYDDKGMVLGLNGMDWSFTIIAKSIYQY